VITLLKSVPQYIFLMILLNILLMITGYLVSSLTNLNDKFNDILILTLLFSGIVLLTLTIFFRGQSKDPGSQTIYSLASVSLKFLLELVLALFWFIVIKKTSMQDVLMFFVIYLTLTIFLIWVMLKTLKNKAL
jgi:hypothetical protein